MLAGRHPGRAAALEPSRGTAMATDAGPSFQRVVGTSFFSVSVKIIHPESNISNLKVQIGKLDCKDNHS